MGYILNCGKTTTNSCIIMLLLSLEKPGNSSSNNINVLLGLATPTVYSIIIIRNFCLGYSSLRSYLSVT